MKKIALLLAAAMLLSSCASIPQGPTFLSRVLGYIQTGCKIVANANDITALIATFPQGATAVSIAKTVCAAVGTGGGARGATVVIHGIPVHYTRAR